MQATAEFKRVEHPLELLKWQEQWQNSLLAPQDGMWESFRTEARHWAIIYAEETIGYAVEDEENGLLNFFVEFHIFPKSADFLQQFLEQKKITKGLIGTHNPQALTPALHCQKSVTLHTYLFSVPQVVKAVAIATDAAERPESRGARGSTVGALRVQSTRPPEESARVSAEMPPPAEVQNLPPILQGTNFAQAQISDLERLIDFYHLGMEAPRTWLSKYLAAYQAEGACYFLEKAGEIIGACEVRASESQPEVADIGMVVGVAYRQQGIGSYLLGQAKQLAWASGRQPICSCEVENIGSRKSIEANGFRSEYQLLSLSF
ncbi:MAG: GNAT family N-acetyltransferase [Bacteroidota bacterium]